MTDTATFIRQVEAMYLRLGKLYTEAGSLSDPESKLLPIAFKELGVAAEELQVATEELRQQNDHMAFSLNQSAEECNYYQSLFDLSPQAQLITSVEGKIQEANKSAARLLGNAQSSLIGKLLINFVPQMYRSQFRSQLNRLSHSSRTLSWSAYLQPQTSGDFLQLLLSATLVLPQNGNSPTVQWLLQDLTSLRIALADSPTEQVVAKDKSSSVAATITAALDQRPHHVYLKGEAIPLKPQIIWQVRSGLVKLSTLTETDEEILLGLAGPLAPFGTGSASLMTYQAIALSDVQLINISIAEINASPSLAQMLLPKFHQRLGQVEALLNVAGQRPVKNRLYHLLLLLKQEIGQPFENGIRLNVRLTHEDLATACCTTRVTVTRLLGDLQRENKITFDRKYHIVLSKDF